ncbi:MAG: helicase-related protein, partial [Pseudomonadota bacterium]
KTVTADTINQYYWVVKGLHKLDALTRILEAEDTDGVIVFVRTKNETVELADRLKARGHEAAPLNGDISQKHREQTVKQLKESRLDILVATDVAARGLDVERISHVINYDIPYDTEAYIHRIGRTGRAGREGKAILFVAPRERYLLKSIEKATRQTLNLLEPPSTKDINERRVESFKQRISDTLESEDLGFFNQLIEKYQQENDTPMEDIAAALAKMVQGNTPMLLTEKPRTEAFRDSARDRGGRGDEQRERKPRKQKSREERKPEQRGRKPERLLDVPMDMFRLEVGYQNNVKPANIVGAIANEAGLDSRYIGQIEIYDDYSTVELPEGMPKETFKVLKKVWVSGCQLQISKVQGGEPTKVEKPKAEKPADAMAKPRRKKAKKEKAAA